MKVLIVCSQNSGKIAPFILEQAESLAGIGVEIDFFPIIGKGVIGYLSNRKGLLTKIRTFQPQFIHAHYGLSGLLANTQRKVPVICTYHGSDINNNKIFIFSKLNMLLSAYNIFVSESNMLKSGFQKKSTVISCGVNTNLFVEQDKTLAREKLGLDSEKKYVLFAGAFDVSVKNSELAIASVNLLRDVELIELKGYTRENVAVLLSAVDALLMTSFTEGSPQIIKEALACNCPIVSVAVGDVSEMVETVSGCYLCGYSETELAEKLELAIKSGRLTNGRSRIQTLKLDGNAVATRILQLYESLS